jgi:hypothetical protein
MAPSSVNDDPSYDVKVPIGMPGIASSLHSSVAWTEPQRAQSGHRQIPDQHRVAAATSVITSAPNNPDDEEEYIVRLVGTFAAISSSLRRACRIRASASKP